MADSKVMSHNEVLSLAEGLKRVGEVKLPFKPSYAISQTKGLIQRRLDAIEAGRVALVKEFAGDADRVPEDKFGEFSKKWGESLTESEPIDLFKFSVKALLESDIKIEPDPLFLLAPILTEE